MPFILSLNQEEKSYDIGIFLNLESLYQFIESIPFVRKEPVSNASTNYFFKFEDLPNYYEVSYNHYLFILSKFSFRDSENEIYFDWCEVPILDQNTPHQDTLIDGMTLVDAYMIPNKAVKHYIEKREELYHETKKFYEKKGLQVSRYALSSEDGEYVTVIDGSNESILYLLDPNVVTLWEASTTIEDFLKQL